MQDTKNPKKCRKRRQKAREALEKENAKGTAFTPIPEDLLPSPDEGAEESESESESEEDEAEAWPDEEEEEQPVTASV